MQSPNVIFIYDLKKLGSKQASQSLSCVRSTLLLKLTSSAMGAKLSKPRDPTDTECHGSNCRWDNGIFTPSFNSEGEVASIPLKQREEQCQAFLKERGAGKQGGTDNLQSLGKVRQVHPASKWDSRRGQVPHSQQPPQVGGQAIAMPCEVQGCG